MTTPRLVYFPDPVPDRANLFDRDPVLDDVLDSLRYRSTVIRGGRLTGKTSLLNVVAQLTDQQREFALIRLAPTDSRAAFMAEILDAIQQWVAQRHRGPIRLREEPRVGTVAQFCQRIAILADRAVGVVFLLCVDEFDSLIQNLDEHEARLILELIEHLDTMPKLPVRFLLTLSVVPDMVIRSFPSPALNQAKIVRLEPWDTDEAARFAEWLVGDRLIFDAAALQALFTSAGGHPYFTKAVVSSLLAELPYTPGSRYVSAERVVAAARSAVRSGEVDLALTNLASAHLSAEAATILDRAAASPAGVTGWSLGDLHSADEALKSLQADGLLMQRGDRYMLRLGLWREWRGATGPASRPPLLHRIARAARQVRRWGVMPYALLIAALAGSLLAMLIATAYLMPQRTIILRPCGATVNLTIYLTYPGFASAEDTQQMHLVVVNNGRADVNGSALVVFPGGHARLASPNLITLTHLRPGEEATQDVDFTTTSATGWLPSFHSQVMVALMVNAGGACRAQRWSIDVAPFPHLQPIQKMAGTLLAVFLVPVLVGLVTGRLTRDRVGLRAGTSTGKGS